MRICVKDKSGNNVMDNLGDVKKYEISDEAYAKREDTFAKFKQNKGITAPKAKGVEDYPQITLGKRCIVESGHRGEVCFFGEIEGKPGLFVGVRLVSSIHLDGHLLIVMLG